MLAPCNGFERQSAIVASLTSDSVALIEPEFSEAKAEREQQIARQSEAKLYRSLDVLGRFAATISRLEGLAQRGELFSEQVRRANWSRVGGTRSRQS